jgi:hypothetical protein
MMFERAAAGFSGGGPSLFAWCDSGYSWCQDAGTADLIFHRVLPPLTESLTFVPQGVPHARQ